jgi:hypothetical protein
MRQVNVPHLVGYLAILVALMTWLGAAIWKGRLSSYHNVSVDPSDLSGNPYMTTIAASIPSFAVATWFLLPAMLLAHYAQMVTTRWAYWILEIAEWPFWIGTSVPCVIGLSIAFTGKPTRFVPPGMRAG